jgi:septal ring factor EnvC (AmiA/AmiB activator)
MKYTYYILSTFIFVALIISYGLYRRYYSIETFRLPHTIKRASTLQTTIDEQKSVIVDQSTTINKLQNDIQSKNMQINSLNTEKAALETHINTLEANNTSLTTNLNKTTNDLNNAQLKLNNAMTQLQNTDNLANKAVANIASKLVDMSNLSNEEKALALQSYSDSIKSSNTSLAVNDMPMSPTTTMAMSINSPVLNTNTQSLNTNTTIAMNANNTETEDEVITVTELFNNYPFNNAHLINSVK